TSLVAWRISQPRPMAKRGCGGGCGPTGRRTKCAIEKYLVPSGSSITCLSRRSGVSKVECTFHSGQVPPNFENGKVPEENRLETLPALSTRSMKKGTPRALGRCKVVRRWHTCSKPALKRCDSTLRS